MQFWRTFQDYPETALSAQRRPQRGDGITPADDRLPYRILPDAETAADDASRIRRLPDALSVQQGVAFCEKHGWGLKSGFNHRMRQRR